KRGASRGPRRGTMARGIPAKVLQYFRRVPLFSDLSKRGLRRVVQAASEIDEPAGTILVREGDTGRELYVLTEGSARVSRWRRLRHGRSGSSPRARDGPPRCPRLAGRSRPWGSRAPP